MSDVRLPYGTAALAHLFRPMRAATSVGVASMLFATPGRSRDLGAALLKDLERMVTVLPALLHPGVPVCLVVSVTLPNGETEAVTALVEMERARHRQDVAQLLADEMPALVTALVERMRPLIPAEAA